MHLIDLSVMYIIRIFYYLSVNIIYSIQEYLTFNYGIFLV